MLPPGGAIGKRSGDDPLPLPADLHPGYALVPTGDDLAETEVDRERLVTVAAGVELRAVAQPSGVLHGDTVVADDDRACPHNEGDGLETVGLGHDGDTRAVR